uniref:Beta-defensin n=1 Tax=Equus asinus TaxID=9793 RepID=A0A8C4L1I5_EQUAS
MPPALFFFLRIALAIWICRGRTSCWIVKGHCRKDCKFGEQVKKPCKNGDYCCIPTKTDFQPHRPIQAPTRNSQTVNSLKRNDFAGLVAVVVMQQE